MASGGGLHGNIPLANLEAYFDARAEVGADAVGLADALPGWVKRLVGGNNDRQRADSGGA